MASKTPELSKTAWDEEGNPAISLNWNYRLMTECLPAVFQVNYDGSQGTGSFYEAYDLNNCRHILFMTCNHVAHTSSIQDIVKYMTFTPLINNDQNDNSFRFLKEHLLSCWTTYSERLDATVVEISDSGEKYLQEKQIKSFLKISDAKPKEKVAILQCPMGKGKFANGIIDDVEDAIVKYQIPTAPGSSGAPVINKKCEAIAIHRRADTKKADPNKPLIKQTDIPRGATAIRPVIDAFFIERIT